MYDGDVKHDFSECPDEIKRLVSSAYQRGRVDGIADTTDGLVRDDLIRKRLNEEYTRKHRKLPRWIKLSITLAVASAAAYLISR